MVVLVVAATGVKRKEGKSSWFLCAAATAAKATKVVREVAALSRSRGVVAEWGRGMGGWSRALVFGVKLLRVKGQLLRHLFIKLLIV